MRYLVLLLMLSVGGMGAMTRDQVCIEQNGWHQASLASYRGYNVWTPYGDTSDEWLCWQNFQDATYMGYGNFGLFKCKIKAGWYMALNKTITNGSVGPVWYPAVDGGGAGVDITESAAWSVIETANQNNWTALYTDTNGRYLDLVVPAGVDRLYMLCIPTGTENHAVGVALQAGSGTIEDASVALNLTSDYLQYGQDAYGTQVPPASNTTWEGFHHYKAQHLIATNCGGATIRLTGVTDTSNPQIIGFTAIDDGGTAQPDTGVMDPTTIEFIMPSSYYNATTTAQTPYNQYVEGPLGLNFNGGTIFWWGGAGGTHMTATNKLVSPTATVYHDTTLWADYNKTTGTTWTLPTEDAWVRNAGDCVTMTWTGVVSLNQDANTVADAGTYTLVHQYTSSGLAIIQKWKFNADAETAVLKLESDVNGGYVSQWSLSNAFTRYLRQPLDTSYQLVGTYDGNSAFASNITTLWRFNTAKNITALFDCGFVYNDASLTTGATKPIMSLLRNTTGDDYNKAYLSPFETSTDIAIAENDEIISYQKRIVIPSTSINDIALGVGVSGSSGGAYKGLYQ